MLSRALLIREALDTLVFNDKHVAVMVFRSSVGSLVGHGEHEPDMSLSFRHCWALWRRRGLLGGTVFHVTYA